MDYGTKRTGLSISDVSGRVAVLKETIEEDSQDKVIERIKEIVIDDDVEAVVIGLPVNMNGESTAMTEQVERFIEKLRNHLTVPVQTADERLTTEMAKELPLKPDPVCAQMSEAVCRTVTRQTSVPNLTHATGFP